MIIVLKSANFSGSGLGKIDVPYTPSAIAQQVIGKFSAISDAGKQKVGIFVDTLSDSGILGKLNYLMLPTVASTPQDAMQNVLLENKTLPPASVGIIRDGGLAFSGKGIINLTSYCKQPIDTESLSIGINAVTASGIEVSQDVLKLSTANNCLRIYAEVSGANANTVIIGESNSRISRYSSGATIVASASSSEITAIGGSGLVSVPRAGAHDENALLLSSTADNSTASYHTCFTGVIRCLFLGIELHRSELQVIKDAIDTLLL